MQPHIANAPRIFLSYAKNEIGLVLNLAEELKNAGGTVWFDRWNLVPGDSWDTAIEKAIRTSDAFVACLSNEYTRSGYKQKEIHLALEASLRRPPGCGFIIPFILKPCEIPDWCQSIHIANPGERTTILALLRGIDRICGSNLVESWVQGKEMGTAECAFVLGDAINRANTPIALMASVGEADFGQSFITRLFEERESSGIAKPAISLVMLKRLSDKLIATLTGEQALHPEFGRNLIMNLGLIKRTLERYNVPLQILEWQFFPPPFHGWIFGEHVMRNSWACTPTGAFHVKTVLRHYTRAGNAPIWQESVSAFENNGNSGISL